MAQDGSAARSIMGPVVSLRSRIVADERVLTAARARYTGRGDVLDVLWWAEHPGTATPEGLPDPAIAVEQDRRALYRPGSRIDPAQVAAAEQAHRADLALAVDAARSVAPQVVQAAVEHGAAAESPSSPRTQPRRRVLLPVVALGAAVAGVVVGAVLTAPPTAQPRSAAALAVFQRPQRASTDLPSEQQAVPTIIDRGSVRRLRAFSTIGTVLYAGRTKDRRVCLFVIVLTAPAVPACTTEAGFAAGGLTLIVRASADPVDDSGRRPQEELDLTWGPGDVVAITPVDVSSPRPASTPRMTGS